MAGGPRTYAPCWVWGPAGRCPTARREQRSNRGAGTAQGQANPRRAGRPASPQAQDPTRALGGSQGPHTTLARAWCHHRADIPGWRPRAAGRALESGPTVQPPTDRLRNGAAAGLVASPRGPRQLDRPPPPGSLQPGPRGAPDPTLGGRGVGHEGPQAARRARLDRNRGSRQPQENRAPFPDWGAGTSPEAGAFSEDEDPPPRVSAIPDFFVPIPRGGGPQVPPRPGGRGAGQLEPD